MNNDSDCVRLMFLHSRLRRCQDEGLSSGGRVQPDQRNELPLQRLQRHRLHHDQDVLQHEPV